MQRRTYLKSTGAAATGLAMTGCLGGDGNGGGNGDGNGGGNGDGNGGGNGDGNGGGSEVIRIGSDIPYRPFEYETVEGELVGFDVDIAEAVFSGQLGYEFEFVPNAFDTIIPSLNNGNFRVIMSAMTINDERAEQVDFSDPYFTAYQTIVVPQDSDVTTKEDLRGGRVGVQKGTTGAGAAAELQEEFGGELNINEYDQIPDAFNALLNGQLDAVINDNTVSAEFVNGEGEGKVRFVEGEGEAAAQGEDAPPYLTLTVENYGIAFRQDDDEFREEVNEALAAIRESGEYDEIYDEYFAG
ncbi:basic amino acid ABC transporter substrate-binding protein [Halorarum salinum]|uniref:Basic amino acid ABC transporter substrate-binding protein n=1 Tax=Halorarum salinum TaxID=2743089 RepID=A0A7D5QHM8_9EURY|nr:transporter substrate-binding domain-containing protein [Halobaculum salinum]QLG63003.1 basic amino acid ABC transporter substrate-binding protein [Halobaculum salinum]